MAKAVKLADIAERLDVSVVTVSKALSGQRGVSEELRNEIKRIADELGYKQPSSYRHEEEEKRKKSGYHLGVLVPDYYLGKYESFYSQMYRQFATKAGRDGNFCMLELVTAAQERRVDPPMMIKDNSVDGIVVIGRVTDDYLNMITSSKIPVVGLDFYTDDPKFDSIVSDSFGGGFRMTNYLFEKGFREIAYVGTLGTTPSITDRYMGYLKSLSEHDVVPRKDWIIDDRDRETMVLDADRYINLPKEMPEAFMCNSDQTAGCLINKLKAAGYRVPKDISVVAYDNFLPPGTCDVRITTYEVDMGEMAKQALSILIRKITGEPYKTGTHVVGGRIVEKDSVGFKYR